MTESATAASETTPLNAFSEPCDPHEAARQAAIAAVPLDPAAAGQPPEAHPEPTERIGVAFAGDGAGVAVLTWGQRDIWTAMVRQGWFKIGGVIPLPPGRTVQDTADELHYMMSRFPSLRTKLRFGADGRPLQELFPDGEVFFEVYDAEEGADPHDLAVAVDRKYSTTARDFAEEWPLRLALVRQGGRLVYLVAISCHLVADGVGMLVLSAEVEARTAAPPRGTEQLDLAAWQQSPAGRRQSAVTMRHFESMLRSTPPRPLPWSAESAEPRHWAGELTWPRCAGRCR